jgi:protocatechuate 3,4-dioxygenase beta subunit
VNETSHRPETVESPASRIGAIIGTVTDHDDHGGLQRDLGTLSRRQMLGAVGLLLVPACGGESTDSVSDAPPGTCSRIPGETAGPFPANGSDASNVLALAGIVRSDIRASFDTAAGVAAGTVLTVTLTIVNTRCEPLVDHAVYIWQCDRELKYSLYEDPIVNENYLRGVQATDASGRVTFTSIFPGCYPGRWPHIHFEIYPSLASATTGANRVLVSQLAFPETSCNEAYAVAGYEASVPNLAAVSLATDGVFRDGSALQLAAVTGSAATGFTATLTVAIAG